MKRLPYFSWDYIGHRIFDTAENSFWDCGGQFMLIREGKRWDYATRDMKVGTKSQMQAWSDERAGR